MPPVPRAPPVPRVPRVPRDPRVLPQNGPQRIGFSLLIKKVHRATKKSLSLSVYYSAYSITDMAIASQGGSEEEAVRGREL